MRCVSLKTIRFILGFVFFYDYEDEPEVFSEPSVNEFEQYPLQAWQTTDITGGDAVKVKYKVDRENTRLYMRNQQGKVVHMTPLSFDPYQDKERIETYVWKLYRTEWTSKIPEIIISNIKLWLELITIETLQEI